MSNEFDDKCDGVLRKESALGSLGREILTDIVMMGVGTGLVVLAIVLAAQDLSVQ